MNQRKFENDPSYDPQLASHWQAEWSFVYLQKNHWEVSTKATWYHVSAHSAIQAKYVQSQGAQATAICLTFARKSTEREGRASNSTLFFFMFCISAKGFAIFPRYSREISLIANVSNLFDPTVCQSTILRHPCSFRDRRLPDLKYLTHPIYANLFAREAVQWERYQGTICTIRSTLYVRHSSLQKCNIRQYCRR